MTDTEKVGPVDHIIRAALPWRTAAHLTECGKAVADLHCRLVTRDEAAARIKRIGQQRAAFTLCMTCAATSDRRNRFGRADAVAVLAREMTDLQHASPPLPPMPYETSIRNAGRRERAEQEWVERQRVVAELEAIAALIAAHREEFDAYIEGREQTVSLADRRSRRRAGGGAS